MSVHQAWRFGPLRRVTSVETNVCELIPKSQIGLCGKGYPLGGSRGLQEHSCRLPIWIYVVRTDIEGHSATGVWIYVVRTDIEGHSATGVWILGYGVQFLAGVKDFSFLQNDQSGSWPHPAY
jgi:hypothetical protein